MIKSIHVKQKARHGASLLNWPPFRSDNGSAYTAKDTRIFAQQIGLKSCFTPVKSPQSNGMSEAFVKTLKCDYIRVNPLPDAEHVLSLIGAWIEDYNENYPHSGLKWKSPHEFIKALTETA
ncbi:insertion element IS2 transposase InsD [Roseibium alexandrii]|uniref:Insertion element IS2 transposase InsD n=1 Tax=Roseibium alexandrii TaxID=388408 RepID=A0A0M7AK48_9HYPH|nr:insertion element IS2 transposase InsD [Roseibium alexandrii]